MSTHKNILTFLALLALLCAGCGGGGGPALTPPGTAGPGEVQESAALRGVLIDADGSTAELAGYRFALDQTGEVAVTDGAGRFAFAEVPGGPIDVRLIGAPVRSEKSGPGGGDDDGAQDTDEDGGDDDAQGNDEDEGDDDAQDTDEDGGDDDAQDTDEDGGDDDAPDTDEDEGDDDAPDTDEDEGDDDIVSESAVRLERTSAGQTVEMRVRIESGRITQLSVSRSERDEREVRVRLQRTDAVADPDLEGKLSVESRDDRQRFKVEVERADIGRELEVFVLDTDGVEESQGLRTVAGVGEAEWNLDTSEGARLPFAAGSVADLDGMAVEVRDAVSGTTLLRGSVPALPPPATSGDRDDTGETDTRERGRSRLAAVEAGLQGHVDVRSRPERGREELKIEAERLAPGRIVAFLIEDPGQPGSLLELGTVAADAFGEAELKRRTDDGQALPGGAARVSELEGLLVEVRDAATDAVLLTGTVPAALLD